MYKRLRLANCESPMYKTQKAPKNYNCIPQRKKNNNTEITINQHLTIIKIWQVCIKYKTNMDHH